jgi:hypothetical protein
MVQHICLRSGWVHRGEPPGFSKGQSVSAEYSHSAHICFTIARIGPLHSLYAVNQSNRVSYSSQSAHFCTASLPPQGITGTLEAGTIADQLGQHLDVSLPGRSSSGPSPRFREHEPERGHGRVPSHQIRKQHESGYIAVLMDVPSINTLRLLVDMFVNQ